MEANLGNFGIIHPYFVKSQGITKNFYKTLDNIYKIADSLAEIESSYGKEAIGELYNLRPGRTSRVLPDHNQFLEELNGLIKNNFTDQQKDYLISEKFLNDIENLRKVFPRDLVKNANYFMNNRAIPYELLEDLKYRDFTSVLGPALNLTEFDKILINPSSLETGNAKYKFSDQAKNNMMEFKIDPNPKKIEAKYSRNIFRDKFNLNGQEFEHSRKASPYFSWSKKFGFEVEDKASSEKLGLEEGFKFGANFKDKFYFGYSHSSKFTEADFKLSQKDVSISSMGAVTKNVKSGLNIQMDHEDKSIMPNVKMQSKIDLQNASMADVLVYAILKPIEISTNLTSAYTKYTIDRALGTEEEIENSNSGKSAIEEYFMNENAVSQEVENSITQVMESEIMAEAGQAILDQEYQELITKEIEEAQEKMEEIQAEIQKEIQAKVTYDRFSGFGL